MFEWNVLCQSGQDLTGGVSGKLKKVTLEELARHSSEGDVWTAVRGMFCTVQLGFFDALFFFSF